MDEFAAKNQDKVVLVYNQFKNAAVQEVQAEQFLPIVPTQNINDKASSTDYIFEPNKEFIVQELIPKSLKTQLFKALLDSRASEHGARMTAMHKATDNATDLINALKLSYNKARQAAITNEILEIVAGAEALNG
jgi:F-type H+-transporting ATPase subunit gamma